jgi:hypothetical protein
MAKLAKTAVFSASDTPKETLLDKTTRVVRRMNNDETELRQAKTARLRKARFENQVDVSDDTIASPSSRAKKRR